MLANFDWFLAFWGWAEERHRLGVGASHPLAEAALYWAGWWSGGASAKNQTAVHQVCGDSASRQEFLDWIRKVWRPKNTPDSDGDRVLLHQLASIEPFSSWSELGDFKPGFFGSAKIRAIVLPRTPLGAPANVIDLQAVAVPGGGPVSGVGSRLRVNSGSALHILAAARGVLHGKGLFALLLSWTVVGRRPYPRIWALASAMVWALSFVFVVAAALFVDGDGAILDALVWAIIWAVIPIAIVDAIVAIRCLSAAWRAATKMNIVLTHSQILMTADIAADVEGTSADLPGSLAVLCALRDASERHCETGYIVSVPTPEGSWIWRNVFYGLRDQAWASTGAIEDGIISRVENVDEKLAACCSAGPEIMHVAVPPDVPARECHCEDGRKLVLHRFASLGRVLLFRSGLQQPWRLWLRVAALFVLGVLVFMSAT